ncbi:MAG: hypothetical protein AAGF32_06285 [Pseudomonadota bacterium]
MSNTQNAHVSGTRRPADGQALKGGQAPAARTGMHVSVAIAALGLSAVLPAAALAQSTVDQGRISSVSGGTRVVAADALRTGLAAVQAGRYRQAMHAFHLGAQANEFFSKFYIGWLHDDPELPTYNPVAAFKQFNALYLAHRDDDPFAQRRRTKALAHATLRAAEYYLTGVPELGLAPDPQRARALVSYAANYLHSPAAQRRLSRMFRDGIGGNIDLRAAGHYLQALSRRDDPQAQADLAEMFWEGGDFPHRPVWALALITLALLNAQGEDHVWISDRHQSMFCGLTPAARVRARELLMGWRDAYGRKFVATNAQHMHAFQRQLVRLCADGMPVLGTQQVSAQVSASATGMGGLSIDDGGDIGSRDDIGVPDYAGQETGERGLLSGDGMRGMDNNQQNAPARRMGTASMSALGAGAVPAKRQRSTGVVSRRALADLRADSGSIGTRSVPQPELVTIPDAQFARGLLGLATSDLVSPARRQRTQ